MMRDEIFEYPYQGTISRLTEGHGDDDDVEVIVYQGMMDETMNTDDEGHALQTSSYVISIPLTKGENGKYIIPRKGDKVALTRFDEDMQFVVDNAEPSQLGGVSVYCTRKTW